MPSLTRTDGVAAIAGFGARATPGIVIDGKLVQAGGPPLAQNVTRWLAA